MKQLIKCGGFALIMAGVFFVITNAVVAPFVDFQLPFDQLLTSVPFLYRMSGAALLVAFLLLGAVGLYLHHDSVARAQKFRLLSFIIVFYGCAVMLANEWHQIFVLPDLAQFNPETLHAFGESNHSGRFLAGGLIALMSFAFGWLLFLSAILAGGKMHRTGPVLVLLGFVVIPVLSAVMAPVWAGAIGSVFLGVGFVWMGMEIWRTNQSPTD